MTNEGFYICCKAVKTQLFTVVVLIVEISTAFFKQRVTFRNILPLGNLPLQEPLTSLLYIPPYLGPYFSEVHFSLTYKMYLNLGLTLKMF